MSFSISKDSPRYGWVVVGASSLMLAYSFGSMVTLSVFLKPLEAQFGWERGDTSFAYASGSMAAGIMGIIAGWLLGRISLRIIVITGAVALSLAPLLLSQIENLWELYLIYALLMGLGNACFMIPLVANAGFWFEKNKGLAIGIVIGGQSLGGGVMPLVARTLMEYTDWRGVYLALGMMATFLLIPLSILVREPPGMAESMAGENVPPSRFSHLTPRRVNTTLSIGIVCCCICMSIPVVHLYPLVIESGFSKTTGASVLAVMMLVSVIGRVGIGQIADKIGGVKSLLISSLIQTLTIYLFISWNSLTGFYVIAVLFGLGYGGVIPAYAIIIREVLAPKEVGRSMGFVFFFGLLGMSLGGYLGGELHDIFGAYPASYAIGAYFGVVNLWVISSLYLGKTKIIPVPATASA